MTELQIAIASGQVSADQIEAHRVAGDLPIVMFEPRFQHTYCSQCGRDCGPGMDGVSGCADHAATAPQPTIKESSKVHASAEDYLRYKYGAYRGHFAWRELEEAYSQGRYDEEMAQGPNPWPGDPQTLRETIDGATDESAHVWCRVSDLRAALDTPESLTRKIRELVEVQGRHGNWNLDGYMQGMFNGMELTLAVLEDREPQFRSKPESGWIGFDAAIKATS